MRSCFFLAVISTKHKEDTDGQHSAESKADNRVLHEARENIGHEAQCRDGDGVRQLSADMVEVVGLCAGRCHNSSVGNGGAVIAADRTGTAGGDADDEELAVGGEYCSDNGNENAEGTPRGAGGKG